MIFDRLFGEGRSAVNPRHPRDPALAEMFGLGSLSSTGIHVNPENALQESAVMSCVKVLSEDMAKLPLFVKQRSGDKTRQATDHPLYDTLHTAPNRNQTSMEWREAGQACVLLRGNSVSKIHSTGGSAIAELEPLHPDHVKIFKTTSGRRAYEHTPDDGPSEILLADEVLHVPGLSLDGGISGLNPIKYYRETIGLAIGLKEFGAKLFKQGATSSLVITHPGNLKAEQLKEYRESIDKVMSGRENWHRPMVFEGGAKIERLSMSPEDSQFLESRKFSRSEIAGIFRVPPHKIGELERATFSNIEQQSIDYVVDSLMPWLVRWEQAMTRWLLTERDRRQGYYVQFEVKGLLRGDALARSQYYKERFNVGSLSPNDIRRLEDENPIAGGDKYFVPLNMRPHDTPMPATEPKTSREERDA